MRMPCRASPGRDAGCGLKPPVGPVGVTRQPASPGRDAGCGDSPWVRCMYRVAECPQIAGFRGGRHCRVRTKRLLEGNPVHSGSSGATVAHRIRATSQEKCTGRPRGLQRRYAVAGESVTVAALGISPNMMNAIAIRNRKPLGPVPRARSASRLGLTHSDPLGA